MSATQISSTLSDLGVVDAAPGTRISVVIPTYRRPESLTKCLQALRAQVRPANEVLVVTQAEDEQTHRLLSEWRQWTALKVLRARGGGAIAQYNLGLEESRGDVIAITDDDSIPHPDWLLRVERWFISHQDLGAVGGRDLVYEDGMPLMGRASRVGVVQWFGRIAHNHHLGDKLSPDVDILKGVNMSFRANALRGIRIDTDLRGKGAQVCLDMALSLAVKKRGWRLLFDPELLVDHYPAPRFDADQRAGPSLEALEDSSYNFYLTLRRHMRKGWYRSAALFWAYSVGTKASPGSLRGWRSRILGDRAGLNRRAAASRAWLAASQTPKSPPATLTSSCDVSGL